MAKIENIDVDAMVESYKLRLYKLGRIETSSLFDLCAEAYKHGIKDTLSELYLKSIKPDKQ